MVNTWLNCPVWEDGYHMLSLHQRFRRVTMLFRNFMAWNRGLYHILIVPALYPIISPLDLYNIHIISILHPCCILFAWWFQAFCIFQNRWDNPSHWRTPSFFKMVSQHHQPDLFETNLGWAVLRFSRDNLFNLVAWTTARAMTGGTQGFSTNGMFEWYELICFHDCLAAAEPWFFNIFHEVSEPYHNQWFSMIIISVFLELASTHSNTTNDHSLISFAKTIP